MSRDTEIPGTTERDPTPFDVPAPRRFSGRTLVRMPAALHAELTAVASEYNISLNRLMVYLLTWGIGKTAVPPDRFLRLKRMFRELKVRE